jgi:hypothetical protein
VANINFTFPDPDDPIFSGEFTVSFPIQSEKSTDAGQPTPTPPTPQPSELPSENAPPS